MDSKVHEVNSQLMNISDERNITFIGYTGTTKSEIHLDESKIHLDKSGTIEFVTRFFEFLLQKGIAPVIV